MFHSKHFTDLCNLDDRSGITVALRDSRVIEANGFINGRNDNDEANGERGGPGGSAGGGGDGPLDDLRSRSRLVDGERRARTFLTRRLRHLIAPIFGSGY